MRLRVQHLRRADRESVATNCHQPVPTGNFQLSPTKPGPEAEKRGPRRLPGPVPAHLVLYDPGLDLRRLALGHTGMFPVEVTSEVFHFDLGPVHRRKVPVTGIALGRLVGPTTHNTATSNTTRKRTFAVDHMDSGHNVAQMTHARARTHTHTHTHEPRPDQTCTHKKTRHPVTNSAPPAPLLPQGIFMA